MKSTSSIKSRSPVVKMKLGYMYDAPSTITIFICFLVLFLNFLLSDFYFLGVGRVFDYVAIAILLIWYALNVDYFGMGGIFGKSILFLIILAPWLLFGGLYNGSILAAIAIAVGMGLIFPISYQLFSRQLRHIVERQIILLIGISAFVLIIQFLAFHCVGVYMDITGSFGAIESRGLNEALNYFRPSGMFQEPNAFCTVMFSLLSTCSYFHSRSLRIEVAGIFSILISQSLWGFGAALLLIYLLYGFRWLVVVGGACSVLATLAFITSGVSLQELTSLSVTLNRIININDDPSRIARLGSLDNIQLDFLFLLGHGVDTLNFQTLAANGLAFLMYCFGVIGTAVLGLFLVFMVRANFKILLVAGFLLTTFPCFSYMFFWMWLAILLALYRTYPKVISSKFAHSSASGAALCTT